MECSGELIQLIERRRDFRYIYLANTGLDQNSMLNILLALHGNTTIIGLVMSGNRFGSQLAETHIKAQINKFLICNCRAKGGLHIEEVDENQNTLLHVAALLNNHQFFYRAFQYLERLYRSDESKLMAFLERKNGEEKRVLDCANSKFLGELAKTLNFTLIRYLYQFSFDFNTQFSEEGDKTILHKAILEGKAAIAIG